MQNLVRISNETTLKYQDGMKDMAILQLRLELLTLQDLVRQLDPDNSYFFSSEYAAFVKTERKSTDG